MGCHGETRQLCEDEIFQQHISKDIIHEARSRSMEVDTVSTILRIDVGILLQVVQAFGSCVVSLWMFCFEYTYEANKSNFTCMRNSDLFQCEVNRDKPAHCFAMYVLVIPASIFGPGINYFLLVYFGNE